MIENLPRTSAFSVTDAAMDGLRVVRENWRLMLGWALFSVIATVALTIATVIVMVTLATLGPVPLAQSVGGLLAGLGSVMILVMVLAALNRLLLRDEEPEFLYLRLGADELRMLVVLLGLWAGLGTLLASCIWAAATVHRAAGAAWGWAAGAVFVVGLTWLAMRLCLSLPAAFATRSLGFIPAWRASRGRVLPLLATNVVAVCLLALTAVVAWYALWLLVSAVSGFHELGLLTLDAEAFAEHPLQSLVQMAGEVLLAPLLLTVGHAPLIAAWRAFRS